MVGRMPTHAQSLAGPRTESPVSVPMPTSPNEAATAAAEPPLDPAVVLYVLTASAGASSKASHRKVQTDASCQMVCEQAHALASYGLRTTPKREPCGQQFRRDKRWQCTCAYRQCAIRVHCGYWLTLDSRGLMANSPMSVFASMMAPAF